MILSRPQPNHRTENRAVCSDAKIINLQDPNSRINADSVQGIIHDRSISGLGVFYLSSKKHSFEEKLKVEEGGIYELRWSMIINKNVQYLGLKLIS